MTRHILRRPAAEWPDPVNRAFLRLNHDVYVPMQGPSAMSASGKILNWDRSADLAKITVPTLVIGARYDMMDPKHMALYDDQATYFEGLLKFLNSL
jgi:proline iminopeptidase